jgi:hypothetical protein
MNYFAHGREFVHQPYLLAGTAVPDWLSVVDRRVRVRSRSALPFVDDPDERFAAVARGVVRHHEDDHWFHRTQAFAELSWDFTVTIREALAPDPGLRPSFLGHILVELLLDAALVADHPDAAQAYYEALERLDASVIAVAVNRMAKRTADRLEWFIGRFAEERFLYDYLDDARLLRRLNQIMRRARLAKLPDQFPDVLPHARQAVRQRMDELLRPVPERATNDTSKDEPGEK